MSEVIETTPHKFGERSRRRAVRTTMLQRPRTLVLFCRCLSRRAGRSAAVKSTAFHPRGREKAGAVRKLAIKKDALLINAVDAADFEGSVPSRGMIQSILGDVPVLLAITKCDRMPRLNDYDLSFLRSRYGARVPNRLLGLHGVSAHTGAGMAELAQRVRDAEGDVVVFGSPGAGKTALVRSLAGSIDALNYGVAREADIEAAGSLLLLGAAGGGRSPGGGSFSSAASSSSASAEPIFCFSDASSRALWDTPSLPNRAAVASRLPPALATPLLGNSALRDRIQIPKSIYASVGQSILLTAENAYDDRKGAAEPITIARVDVLDVQQQQQQQEQQQNGVDTHRSTAAASPPPPPPALAAATSSDDSDSDEESEDHGEALAAAAAAAEPLLMNRPPSGSPPIVVSAYVPPSIRVTVVKTEEAPDALYASRGGHPTADDDAAALAQADIHQDVEDTRTARQSIRIPFEVHHSYNNRKGTCQPHLNVTSFNKAVKSYATDICFAGIGHIGFYNRSGFTLCAYALDDRGISVRKPMYPRVIHLPSHLDEEAIRIGLGRKELYEGLVVQRRPGAARVVSSSAIEGQSAGYSSTNILLKGRDALNRALHGDRVAVRLLPKSLWVRPGTLDEEEAEMEEAVGMEEVLENVLDDTADDGEEEDGGGVDAKLAPNWNFLEAAAAAAGGGGGGGGGDGTASSDKPLVPRGEVVGILQRNPKPFIGVLDPKTHRKQDQYLAPRKSHLPKVRVPMNEAGELERSVLYAVTVKSWLTRDRFPTATLHRMVGPVGESSAESEAILIENGVDKHAAFSDAATSSLPSSGWVPDPIEVAKRLDLREGIIGESICSVDPPGCVDIDDALHAIEIAKDATTGRRQFEVGVHIADVGHFIQAGHALDTEASQRGTTFYLVDQRVNMVPDVLGENVASLHAGRDRYAFSCIWTLDEDATILNSKVMKTVIRSRASYSYTEAQALIDGEVSSGGSSAPTLLERIGLTTTSANSGRDAALTTSLQTLHMLSKKLQAERIAGGALRLASPEVKFEMTCAAADEEGGTREEEERLPTDMGLYLPLESNGMVEEFMLLANVTIAKLIKEHFPQTALLRRHPHPQASDFSRLHEQLTLHGHGLNLSSPTALASSLDACSKADEPYFNLLARFMAVRCMPAAEYVCAGEADLPGGESHHHFGLAAPIYSHFTSPIRRYADQIVHRMAAVAIGWEAAADTTTTTATAAAAARNNADDSKLYDVTAMSELARHLNERHAAAKEAERASVALYALKYFRNHQVIEPAYAISTYSAGLTVLVPKFGLEGWCYASPRDGPSPFRWSAEERSLTAEGITIRPMDRVLVRVSVDTQKLHPRLQLELLDEESGEPLCEAIVKRAKARESGGM